MAVVASSSNLEETQRAHKGNMGAKKVCKGPAERNGGWLHLKLAWLFFQVPRARTCAAVPSQENGSGFATMSCLI